MTRPGTTTPVAESVITLTVNGETHELFIEARWTLDYVLREELGLTGTKE